MSTYGDTENYDDVDTDEFGDDLPILMPGSDPNPGRGWQLVDYRWIEKTGVGKFLYRQRGTDAKRKVLMYQPADPMHHESWSYRGMVAFDRDAVLARHFEAIADTRRLAALGAYSGRA